MGNKIMDEVQMKKTVSRMAHEILERNDSTDNLALIGIRRRGVPLARLIADKIKDIEGVDIPVGELDITLYRDDLSTVNVKPVLNGTVIPFSTEGMVLVMVDDVIYTGRTARAAMDALIDRGRPQKIQLAVLIDRGHRELPIRPDYVGKSIPTSQNEIVMVQVTEIDGQNAVEIRKKGDAQ